MTERNRPEVTATARSRQPARAGAITAVRCLARRWPDGRTL